MTLTERLPECATAVSTVTVPVPVQLAAPTVQRPPGVLPVCCSKSSQMVALAHPAGGGPDVVVVGVVVVGVVVVGVVDVGGAGSPHETPLSAKSVGVALVPL